MNDPFKSKYCKISQNQSDVPNQRGKVLLLFSSVGQSGLEGVGHVTDGECIRLSTVLAG